MILTRGHAFFQDEGKIAHTALTQKTSLCSKE